MLLLCDFTEDVYLRPLISISRTLQFFPKSVCPAQLSCCAQRACDMWPLFFIVENAMNGD
jgi:hypothetical protein